MRVCLFEDKAEADMKSFFEKAIVLIPLGCMAGLWIEVRSLKSIDEYQPMVGPLIGMSLAGMLSLGCRSLDMRGFFKRAMTGIILGAIFGVFVGVPVYEASKVSAALTELKEKDPAMHAFVVSSTGIYSYSARYQRDGVLFCVPLGFLLGFLAALAVQIWCKVKGERPDAEISATNAGVANIPTGA
jgi:hypothetical protein